LARLAWLGATPLLVLTGCGAGDRGAEAPAYEGRLEAVKGTSITGWVWDRNHPWPATKVDVYDGDTLLATVTADRPRADLLHKGIGSGHHGFTYTAPERLIDGEAHTIRAVVSGTSHDLDASPKTITFQPGMEEDDPYQLSVLRTREVVRANLPPDATVLVVGKDADDFLKLEGRKAWHFPRDEDGNYAGNPADGKEAIARLEAARVKGGQYLLFPQTAFWWLNEYKEFKEHLDARYSRIHKDKHCIIYQLTKPKAR
jgi:hypothetical protein